MGSAEDDANWVVWVQDSQAWASVVVRHSRPYPVTVAPAPIGNVADVQVAAFDADAGAMDVSPDRVAAVPSLKVPSGGCALVLLHVSDRCVPMMAGGATGIDAARVNVTTFGITHSLEAPLPATYMAGTTTGHAADPACGAE